MGDAEIEQMEIPESSPAARSGLKTGYGKGIKVDFLNYKFPFYGHDGAGLGFNSRYAYNRALKAGFVICCSNLNLFFASLDKLGAFIFRDFESGKRKTVY